ncbi:MAG TPA: HK97 gp10 family phage protein [Acidimicrobiia bacterium]|nr:HK97 gp10 family phage protein [Acidimicrobiia bacterium]
MDLTQQLHAKAAFVAQTVAAEVEAELRQAAPVDSGELRDSVTARSEATPGGAEITIEAAADHAPFVREFRDEWERMRRDLPDRIARVWDSTG